MFDSAETYESLLLYLFLKKRRWTAWESNPGPHDGRRRRNHGAMAATQIFLFLKMLQLIRENFLK